MVSGMCFARSCLNSSDILSPYAFHPVAYRKGFLASVSCLFLILCPWFREGTPQVFRHLARHCYVPVCQGVWRLLARCWALRSSDILYMLGWDLDMRNEETVQFCFVDYPIRVYCPCPGLSGVVFGVLVAFYSRDLVSAARRFKWVLLVAFA